MGFGFLLGIFGGYAAYAGYGLGLLAAGVGLVAAGGAAAVFGIVIWHNSKTFRIGEKWKIINPQGTIVLPSSGEPY